MQCCPSCHCVGRLGARYGERRSEENAAGLAQRLLREKWRGRHPNAPAGFYDCSLTEPFTEKARFSHRGALFNRRAARVIE